MRRSAVEREAGDDAELAQHAVEQVDDARLAVGAGDGEQRRRVVARCGGSTRRRRRGRRARRRSRGSAGPRRPASSAPAGVGEHGDGAGFAGGSRRTSRRARCGRARRRRGRRAGRSPRLSADAGDLEAVDVAAHVEAELLGQAGKRSRARDAPAGEPREAIRSRTQLSHQVAGSSGAGAPDGRSGTSSAPGSSPRWKTGADAADEFILTGFMMLTETTNCGSSAGAKPETETR